MSGPSEPKRVDSWGQDADDDLEVHADAVSMLAELDGEGGLSPWEEDFVADVLEAVDAGRMTDRQAEKVRQIHDERIRQGRPYRRREGKR